MSRRVVMGSYPGVGSGFGLRCSFPGKDALSSDPNDLVFDSDAASQIRPLQIGTFVVSDGQTISFGINDQGYVPFASFIVKIYEGPYGTPSYVPVVSPGWHNFGQIRNNSYNAGQSYDASFLKLRVFRTGIQASYNIYNPNNNSLGWPKSWLVAYAVYKVPAAYG